jgi:hypothetical protein
MAIALSATGESGPGPFIKTAWLRIERVDSTGVDAALVAANVLVAAIAAGCVGAGLGAISVSTVQDASTNKIRRLKNSFMAPPEICFGFWKQPLQSKGKDGVFAKSTLVFPPWFIPDGIQHLLPYLLRKEQLSFTLVSFHFRLFLAGVSKEMGSTAMIFYNTLPILLQIPAPSTPPHP